MAPFKIAAALALAVALAGCGAGVKIKAEPQFQRIECKRYSDEEMKQAAAELRRNPSDYPMLAAFADDYGALRAAVCKTRKKSG